MTYEYICTACSHEWEAEQPITAAALKECPSCGKATAQRQVSGGTGFVLKGGGWYADGYGSSGIKSSKRAESASSSSDSSSDSGSSDASSKADKPKAKPVSTAD